MPKVDFQARVTGTGYGYVYIMSYPGDERLKIGHSLDPFDRAKDIGGTKAPQEPIVEASFWCSERREDVERASHRLEQGNRHNGEWFFISMERAFEVIRLGAKEVSVEIQLVYDRQEITKLQDEKAKALQDELIRQAEIKKAEDELKLAEKKHLEALTPKCMNCGTQLIGYISKGGNWVRCKSCGYDQIKR